MRKLIIFILLFVSVSSFAQNIDLVKKAQELTDEGKHLYRLELASWHGTDMFLANFKDRDRIGGYFSYIDDGTPKCIFFSKGDKPKVIGSVSFGDIKLVETATFHFNERDFNKQEKELYDIRQEALKLIQEDTLFKSYSNSNLNLIPTIYDGQRRVYILTGPKNSGVVLLGNDYLLEFDKDNKLTEKKQIHQNLIPIQFAPEEQEDGKQAVATVHSHLPETGEFITPTDICTLMLYAKYAGWKQHIVISDSYVSIWDCENESLVIMTDQDFEKMSN